MSISINGSKFYPMDVDNSSDIEVDDQPSPEDLSRND